MTTLVRDEPRTAEVPAEQVSARAVSAEERLVEVAPMVRRMCRARLGSWDGDDAAQEVLLRLWQLQQRPEYAATTEPAPLFGWAAAGARFQVLNAVRARSQRVVPAGELAEQLWVDPQAGPEEQAVRRAQAREARDRVGELVPQLSLRERQVILASEFGTRSNVETAARLGISREAVSVAKQNAIARLRELAGVDEPGSRAGRRAARYRDSPEYRASVARREAQQAALVAAAEQLPRAGAREVGGQADVVEPAAEQVSESVAGTPGGGWKPGRAGWPQEVHDAGRAALREGWNTEDVARELGVGVNLVRLWRRANTKDTGAVDVADGSTAELIERARRAVAQAQQRRSEVEAYARVFGAARGRGVPVPEIVVDRAREAARCGWTPAEMERGFAINRATAKRWIAEESTSQAEPRQERDGRAELRVDGRQPGRLARVGGGDRADAAGSDTGQAVYLMGQARRAVEALPSPAQARAVAEECEQLAGMSAARLDDVTEHGDQLGDGREDDEAVSAA